MLQALMLPWGAPELVFRLLVHQVLQPPAIHRVLFLRECAPFFALLGLIVPVDLDSANGLLVQSPRASVFGFEKRTQEEAAAQSLRWDLSASVRADKGETGEDVVCVDLFAGADRASLCICPLRFPGG